MELDKLADRLKPPRVVIIGWLAGIAGHSIFPFERLADGWAFAASAAVGLAGANFVPWRFTRRACLLLLAAMLGFWRFDATMPGTHEVFWLGSSSTFVGRVVAVPDAPSNAYHLVRLESVNGFRVARAASGFSVKLNGERRKAGSVVSFVCTARAPGTSPPNLERRKSLARKGVWSECASAMDAETLAPPSPLDPLAWLMRWRESLTERIQQALPPDEAMLVAGILYGEQDFSAELREDFKRAGLMHLVAVSGSNVTIVVSVFLGLLLGVGLGRRQAFWGVTLALLAFVGFVGFGASILRAAFMGWLVILARHVGRMARTRHLLLMAAAVLNVFNPWLLAFDPGFALSFLATWGLMAWAPVFERRLAWLPQTLGLRESLATTLGATLMTAPYLAWAFGRMSLAGILTNALALPLVPWAMLWGSVAAVWGDLPGGSFVSLPAYGLAHLVILISRASRLAPWLDWRMPEMEWAMLAAGYLWLAIWWKSLSDGSDTGKSAVDRVVSSGGMSDSADSEFGRFGLIPR
jgi:ComEC/Rec2-related protein